jgi:hypothetical protein
MEESVEMDQPIADIQRLRNLAYRERRVEAVGREVVAFFVPLDHLAKFGDRSRRLSRVGTPCKELLKRTVRFGLSWFPRRH